jgi:hypothetical protein
MGLLTAAAFFQPTLNLGAFFNSDDLYLPVLYEDLFKKGFSLMQWNLPPANYLFPDFLLFCIVKLGILNFFSPSTLQAFMLYGLFQVFLTLLLAHALLRKVLTSDLFFPLVVLFFSVVFYSCICSSRHAEIYTFLVQSVRHFGAFLSSLFVLYCYLQADDSRNKKWILFILWGVAFLSTASDLFFVLEGGFPLCCTIFFAALVEKKNFKKSFPPLIILSAGMLLGRFFLDTFSCADATRIFTALQGRGFITQLSFLWGAIKTVASSSPLLFVYTLLFYALTISDVVKSLILREFIQSHLHKKLLFVRVFILFSVFSNVTACFFYNLWSHVHGQKYIIPFFWFPIVFCWLPWTSWKKYFKKIQNVLYCASIFLLLHGFFTSLGKSWRQEFINPKVSCVDKMIAKYRAQTGEDIRYGISQFWEAKLTDHLSREGIKIAQYTLNVDRFQWINSRQSYYQSYDFVLCMKDYCLDPPLSFIEAIEKRYGPPKKTLRCEKHHVVIAIYGKGKLLPP